MSKHIFLLTVLVAFSLLSIVSVASAEDMLITGIEDNVITDQVLAESADLADEPEVLEGVQIEEPKSIPSGFGVWWLNLKEKVSLGLTFNSVKKAEKQLEFAEGRIKLAEYMIENSTDEKVQEKAQQMIERAEEYINRVEEKKSDLVFNSDQKVKTLLDNVAKHYLNREKAMEKIEDKIPPEELEQFQQLRQTISERRETFLEYLGNSPNAPQEVKDRVFEVSQKIEDIKEEREAFREEQKDLLEQIKAGSQEAKEAFQLIREEKKQAIEQARQQFKEERAEIINRIEEGDNTAVEELKQLNEEQKQNIQQIIQDVKEKTTEIKNELTEKREEVRQQMEENREQNDQQTQGGASQ